MQMCTKEKAFLAKHATKITTYQDKYVPCEGNCDCCDMLLDYMESHLDDNKMDRAMACFRMLFKLGRSRMRCACKNTWVTMKTFALETFSLCVFPSFSDLCVRTKNEAVLSPEDDTYFFSFENAFSFLTCATCVWQKHTTKKIRKNHVLPLQDRTVFFRDSEREMRPKISFFEWLLLLNAWHSLQTCSNDSANAPREFKTQIEKLKIWIDHEKNSSCSSKPMNESPQEEERKEQVKCIGGETEPKMETSFENFDTTDQPEWDMLRSLLIQHRSWFEDGQKCVFASCDVNVMTSTNGQFPRVGPFEKNQHQRRLLQFIDNRKWEKPQQHSSLTNGFKVQFDSSNEPYAYCIVEHT